MPSLGTGMCPAIDAVVDEVAALAVPLHAFGEDLDAVHHAVDVHPGHPVPVLPSVLVHRATDGDAGVVADHVHVAEPLLGGVGGLGHRLAVGDVHLQRQELGVAGLELARHRGERVILDVGDHDLHAGVGERPRHREPHTAGAAGDERDFPRNVLHVPSSL